MKFGKHTKKLCVPEGKPVRLSRWKTCVPALYRDSDDYAAHLEQFKSKLNSFQEKLYASSERAILMIFQGMDTSGKDGAISHVMSGVNPQGCFVYSFKKPSDDELKHDFLWRTHVRTPRRGEIGIFNRSYYEEALITRVHPGVLDQQHLPKEARGIKHFWKTRLDDIRNHEDYLTHQGVKVIKFFLHISKEEQRRRLLARIEEPKKHWKISIGDFQEREYWNQYTKAYEAILSETSTENCPWFVIPADDKRNARVMISQVLLDEVKQISVSYPALSAEQRWQIKKMKKSL